MIAGGRAGVAVTPVLVALLPVTGCFSRMCQGPPPETACANDLDDDGDGWIDCDDGDCLERCADAAFADAGPSCGDGRKEGGEECDGDDVGGLTCALMGFTGGAVQCAELSCTLSAAECWTCGDGAVTGPEECDGSPGKTTCADLGFTAGTLGCAPSCTFDASGCTICGNGTIETGEECDDANAIDGDACPVVCIMNCTPSAWTKYPGNPVLDVGPPGSWDDEGVEPGAVLLEAGIYRMWYGGFDGASWRIGHAASLDGISWIKDGIVLELGPPGSLDELGVRHPAVRYDGMEYRMAYGGESGLDGDILDAVSTDGLSWTRGGVLVGAATPFPLIAPATLTWEGSDLLWFTAINPGMPPLGGSSIVNMKTSSGLSPSLEGWDSVHTRHPDVAVIGAAVRMFYAGNDGVHDRIGMGHSSAPALPWLRYGMIIDIGFDWEWDSTDVNSPAVLIEPDVWHLWYAGFDGTTYRVGYASALCAP